MSSVPWQPRAVPVDRGEADPALRVVLASGYDDGDAYVRAVSALCTARLILPTVEAPPDAELGLSKADDPDDPNDLDHDEGDLGHSPRAAVLLRSASGEKAVLAFTGYDALRAWRTDAHPVRCTLDDVAATVLETGASTIVVDVAGPHQLIIESDLIAELARGRRLAALPDGTFAWLWLDAGPNA